MVKITLVGLHLLFGVAGNIFGLFALHFLTTGQIEKLRRWISFEFISALLTLIAAASYYIFFYQEEKSIINDGMFPAAHGLFMEVKEHAFILFFLVSLYLQIRMRKIRSNPDAETKSEIRTLLFALFFLGLLMSVTGFFVNAGFRINQ